MTDRPDTTTRTGATGADDADCAGDVDEYQARYLAHQARKRDILISIMEDRHSERRFADDPVPSDLVDRVTVVKQLCPSSCNRQGIRLATTTDRDHKALLGGVLVGGVGWIHRAPVVVLLFADPLAYKAGDEITYMPFLDAGVVVQQLLLSATSLGLASAYANPNVRDMNRGHFHDVFDPFTTRNTDKTDNTGRGVFCGAVAIGYPFARG